MAALWIGAQLYFINGQKIAPHPLGHGLDRANPIGGAIWHDTLFASHQRHHRRAAQRHDLVVDLARQQAQWQTDHTSAMCQHPLDCVMGLAGVGWPKDRRYPRILGHCAPPGSEFAAHHPVVQPGAGGLRLLVMRVYLKDKHIGLVGQLWPPHLFQKHGQTIKRIEMGRVQM